MFRNLCFCNETSGISSTANTDAEGGTETDIGVLLRIIEILVKERIVVNPKLEENFNGIPGRLFSNISLFYF